MSERIVRSAESVDSPAIERVARESWHAAYDDVLGAETVEEIVDEWYDPDGLSESTEKDDGVFVVVIEAGEIRGFAHAGPSRERDAWHLFRLYVVPDYWREGVGTALLEGVEADLEAQGVPIYELTALAENDAGVSFYESRGFERFETETVELAGVETTQHWYRKTL